MAGSVAGTLVQIPACVTRECGCLLQSVCGPVSFYNFRIEDLSPPETGECIDKAGRGKSRVPQRLEVKSTFCAIQ